MHAFCGFSIKTAPVLRPANAILRYVEAVHADRPKRTKGRRLGARRGEWRGLIFAFGSCGAGGWGTWILDENCKVGGCCLQPLCRCFQSDSSVLVGSNCSNLVNMDCQLTMRSRGGNDCLPGQQSENLQVPLTGTLTGGPAR